MTGYRTPSPPKKRVPTLRDRFEQWKVETSRYTKGWAGLAVVHPLIQFGFATHAILYRDLGAKNLTLAIGSGIVSQVLVVLIYRGARKEDLRLRGDDLRGMP